MNVSFRTAMKKWHKTILVITGAIVFSTVAIQASDVLRDIDGNMAGMVMDSQKPCGPGAVQVILGSGALCVDMYEASTADTCPVALPASGVQTQENMNESDCSAISEKSKDPWRYVSLAQAQQLCARAGKRLPTNDEWYALASSIGDQSACVIHSTAAGKTGDTQCVTQSGIYDMVGNLWEWIDAEVYDGQYNNRPLPESGYVQTVDSNGVVIETSDIGNEEYGDDYATMNITGVRGILRGGFYGSNEDAGLYAQNIAVPLDFKAPGVGFRCVKSI